MSDRYTYLQNQKKEIELLASWMGTFYINLISVEYRLNSRISNKDGKRS